MSASTSVSLHNSHFPVTQPYSGLAADKIQIFEESLERQDWNRLKDCTDELFGFGRGLIAQSILREDQPFNPLPMTLKLFKALVSPEMLYDRKSMLHVTRAARLFLELTYMKCQNESRPLYQRDRDELFGYLNTLKGGLSEEEVALAHELECCMEAYRLIDYPEFKDYALRIVKAFARTDVKSIITEVAPILFELIKRRVSLWYLDSLYISWAGPLTTDNLKLLQEIYANYKKYCDIPQIAQTFVGLYGELVWKGNSEVQLEALEGLILLGGKSKRDTLPPLREVMWPVRKRVVEILASLIYEPSPHPSAEIVSKATDALCERREKETDKKVLVLLEKLENSKQVRNRLSVRLEENRNLIEQKNEKEERALTQRESEIRDKEAELEQRINQSASNNVEALRTLAEERAQIFKVREAMALERHDLEQRQANLVHISNEILREANALNSASGGGATSASASSTQSFADLNIGRAELRKASSSNDTTSAIIRFEQSANGQNKIAEFYMGFIYSTDRSPALKEELEGFPNDENVKDLLLLWGYQSNSIYPRSNSRALSYYLRAAQQGVPIAIYLLGRCHELLGDYQQAAECYQKGVAQSHTSSINALGRCYEEGLGVIKDLTRAYQLYEQAAKSSHLAGECNYARCLIKGIGTRSNPEEGFSLLQPSAENNRTESLFLVARCLEEGRGTKRDFKQAFTNYLLIAERDYPEAQCILGKIYYLGGEGVDKNLAEALRWTKRAAALKHPEALYNLGNFYLDGTGVEKNPRMAVNCFRSAAERKHVGAMLNLGEFSAKGLYSVLQDEGEARKWYEQAAAVGSPAAEQRLAKMTKSKKSALNKSALPAT